MKEGFQYFSWGLEDGMMGVSLTGVIDIRKGILGKLVLGWGRGRKRGRQRGRGVGGGVEMAKFT